MRLRAIPGCIVFLLMWLGVAAPLAVLLRPADGLCGGLDDIEFGSDVRLRWRWVDSGTPGPLRSTYGEFIQRGISLKHRFIFDIAYPLTGELRIGGRLRASNEPVLVLTTGPDYYSSEFGSAFIAYETPSLQTRFGYYETYYTPLTLMRWDLKDDAEGGGCPVCASTPGTAGAILGESLEILGPVLTFEGLSFKGSYGSMLGFDAFYARPRVAQQTDYGQMRQVNTYGGRVDLSRYLSHASGLFKVSLIAVRSEEDNGSVEVLEGPPGYPPEPFRYTVYGLALEAPLTRWLSVSGDLTATRAHMFENFSMVDRDGKGAVASLDIKTHDITFESAFIYLTPGWDSYFRALSYSPDRKGWRSRLVIDKKKWLVSVFARHLITVNTISAEDGDRVAYPTWSIQGSYRPRTGVVVSGSVVYTGAGVEKGTFDFEETSRLYTYVIALIADVARGTTLTLENRYLNNRDYENKAYNYNADMLTLYLRAEIW
jgi:hypothetical protein